MKKIDEQTAKAIVNLSPDKNFKMFLNWMLESQKEGEDRFPGLAYQPDELKVCALETKILKDILKQVDTATADLAKIITGKSHQRQRV